VSVTLWPPVKKSKLITRDGAHCPHCGTQEALTIQHRGVAGMGSRRSAQRPSNVVLLCWAYNVAIEQDAALSAEALAAGWKISTHADPSKVPYLDATTGTRWQLADDYTKTAVP
jgi:hypothetical protein